MYNKKNISVAIWCIVPEIELILMRHLTFQILFSKYVQEFFSFIQNKGGAFALDGVLLACGVEVGVCLKHKYSESPCPDIHLF